MKRFDFKKAQAVWAKGRSTEMNCELCFKSVISNGKDTHIYLASSGIYRLWVNGRFVAAGPARTAHGYFRTDDYMLDKYLEEGENVVAAEVLGYNVNTYDTLDQPSFFTAEISRKGRILAYTGDSGIAAYDLGERVQKVQRYSFQRAFIDAYQLLPQREVFYKKPDKERLAAEQEIQPQKRYLCREVRYPQYEVMKAIAIVSRGQASFDAKPRSFKKTDAYFSVGRDVKGFPDKELSLRVSEDAQKICCLPDTPEQFRESFQPLILKDGFALYELEYNASGFYSIELEARSECKAYVLFDEIRQGGDIDFLRMYSCNCFYYQISPGKNTLMSFAPYTMKYIKVIVKGECRISSVSFIEYKHPPVRYRVKLPDSPGLSLVYKAALESFRANSLDVFMDCPSRERGGWLCDSYFTSCVERVLTGENILERSFLENFILNSRFDCLPEGMLPMCYPADHNNGNFIPNWAMWFVLELEKYEANQKSHTLAEKCRPAVYRLFEYLSFYENREGLLENLPGWVFVEWSSANDRDMVEGINFPTNMLYYRTLLAAGRLYQDGFLLKKAGKLKEVIRLRSFNGEFFMDNPQSRRCTEVCQYYAFFTGIADRESDGLLWNRLVSQFGPDRLEKGRYPEIAGTNMFIGKYLRLQLLYEAGLYQQVLDGILAYFLPMAEKTGTLWEHDSPAASLNHGFASYVIYWLAGIFGVEET